MIITPHIAGQSDGLQARRIELFMENIARFDKGEPMFNVVDKIGILGSQARDIPEQSARMKRD